MNFIFQSKQRIKQSKIFEQAFRNKGLTNKWFTIHLIDSKHNNARLGMVVSKRVVPKSVCRNYVKRYIRELFRHNFSNLPTLDLIVRVRRSFTKKSSGEAREALLQLMQNIKNL